MDETQMNPGMDTGMGDGAAAPEAPAMAPTEEPANGGDMPAA